MIIPVEATKDGYLAYTDLYHAIAHDIIRDVEAEDRDALGATTVAERIHPTRRLCRARVARPADGPTNAELAPKLV